MPNKLNTKPNANSPLASRSAVTTVPLQLKQYRVVASPESRVDTLEPSIRLSPNKVAKILNNRATYGLFFQNVPITDAFCTVRTLAKRMYDMVYNYDLEHRNSWFEANTAIPDVVGDPSVPKENRTTAYYKTDSVRRELCTAAAIRAYNFGLMRSLNIASYANCCNLSRYQGEGLFADLASIFRWSLLRPKGIRFSDFPAVRGHWDRIKRHTTYAYGKTAGGAPLFAIAYWRVSPFGSVGSHVLEFEQDYSAATNEEDANFGVDMGGWDDESSELDEHLYSIFSEYSVALQQPTDDKDHTAYVGLRDPDIENGLAISVHTPGAGTVPGSYEDQFINAALNGSSDARIAKNGAYSGNIANAAWGSYEFTLKELLTQYKEFTDVTNAWYSLWVDQIPYLEPAPQSHEEFYRDIVSNKFYSVDDVTSAMTFAATAAPNTTPFIRYSLPLHGANGSVDDVGVWKDNYQRYDALADDMNEAVRRSKYWPLLTPTVFAQEAQQVATVVIPENPKEYDGWSVTASDDRWDENGREFAPIVKNLPLFGTPSEMLMNNVAAAHYGKAMSLRDLAFHDVFGGYDTQVQMQGLDDAATKEYVAGSVAVTFIEDPSQVRVLEAPMIDASDPYQAGWYVILSNNQVAAGEWASFFKDAKARGFTLPDGFGTETADNPDSLLIPKTKQWKAARIPFPGTKVLVPLDTYVLADVAYEEYLERKQHCLIFVGAAFTCDHIDAQTLPARACPRRDYDKINVDIIRYAYHTFGAQSGTATGLGAGITLWVASMLAAGNPVLGEFQERIKAATHEGEEAYTLKVPAATSTLFTAFASMAANVVDDPANHQISIFTFNPQYGPVAPVTPGLPWDNCEFEVECDAVYDSRHILDKDEDAGYNAQKSLDDFNQDARDTELKASFTLDDRDVLWMPYLLRVAMKTLRNNEWHMPTYSEASKPWVRSYAVPMTVSLRKACTTDVSFPGAEDGFSIINFTWDDLLKKADEQTADANVEQSVEAFRLTTVIADARKPRSVTTPRGSAASAAPATDVQHEVSADTFATGNRQDTGLKQSYNTSASRSNSKRYSNKFNKTSSARPSGHADKVSGDTSSHRENSRVSSEKSQISSGRRGSDENSPRDGESREGASSMSQFTNEQVHTKRKQSPGYDGSMPNIGA